MNPAGGHPTRIAIRNLASKNSSSNFKNFVHKRIPFAEREKAAYLILRRAGLSINQISKAFGRSTSVIHRALTRVETFGHNLDVWCRRVDIRKLPYKTRMRMASFRWRKMLKLLSQWTLWVCGEGDRPP